MQNRKLIGLVLIGAVIMLIGACGGEGASSSQQSLAEGQSVFQQYCVVCHGRDGKMQANGAKDLTLSQMPLKDRVALIKSGKNLMASFNGILSPDQIDAAAKYTMTFK